MKVYQEVRNGQIVPVSMEIENEKEVEFLLEQLRPKGKWVNHRNDYGHNIADCSVCGHAMQWHDEDEDGVPRFCWFCGAKIDSVED